MVLVSFNEDNRLSWEITYIQDIYTISILGKCEILLLDFINFEDKKEEIWPIPMTKAPIPTEMSKGQSSNTNNATKKFD